MDTEKSKENEWQAIEKKLLLMYGDKAYQRMTENEWWRYDYCERRKKLEKQIERQKKIIVNPLIFPTIFDDQKAVAKKNRQSGQRSRWFMNKFSRIYALENLRPIDCVEQLISKMSWHSHHRHILAVATYPGVTSQQLTDCMGLTSSNHRMVFRLMNNDLYHVGWQFVSCQVGFKNEPWGWYLEKI